MNKRKYTHVTGAKITTEPDLNTEEINRSISKRPKILRHFLIYQNKQGFLKKIHYFRLDEEKCFLMTFELRFVDTISEGILSKKKKFGNGQMFFMHSM